MIKYFGYGSNMDLTALKAKGVVPVRSMPASLSGWQLRFSVEHFFRHEGGVGNIAQTREFSDKVLGIVHWCDDHDLAALDKLEARGVGYDRVTVRVETSEGVEDAYTYVGLPAYVNDAILPLRRYLNILVRGAKNAGLASDYIASLQAHPITKPVEMPPFTPADTGVLLDHRLVTQTQTVLAGYVFDMCAARAAHVVAQSWFASKDVTIFLLKRMDSSDGTEQLVDMLNNRLRADQRRYLNTYLHAFADEYEYVGQFDYASLPAGMELR